MGFHVQLDLKAIEQAPAASGAAGIGLRDHLAGLALMYHHVWTKKTDRATRELLMGWFAVGPDQVPRLIAGLVAFGHLEALPGGIAWRIKGAGRYENLRKGLSEGGKKSKGNLKQYQQPPASTSSSQSGPAAPSTPAAAKTRELSGQEQCWDFLEHLRVEHCTRLGIPPGVNPRPRLCNKKLNDACQAVGVVDQLLGGEAVTRWVYLSVLFELYLGDELGRLDREGQQRTPPWPIELFLSEGVLRRFKEQEERAA